MNATAVAAVKMKNRTNKRCSGNEVHTAVYIQQNAGRDCCFNRLKTSNLIFIWWLLVAGRVCVCVCVRVCVRVCVCVSEMES